MGRPLAARGIDLLLGAYSRVAPLGDVERLGEVNLLFQAEGR